MMLDAHGPEQTRAAFAAAFAAAGERVDKVGGIAGVLDEAADRYESLDMQPSTVEHLRDAGRACGTAQAAVATAAEHLRTALADFNARDGQVADAVADAGGSLAGQEVLVGDDAGGPAPDHVEEKTVTATPPAGSGPGTKDRVRDRLRVGGRMVLRDGERLIGSASVAGSEGELVLAAAVDTPTGRQVHLALPIYPEDKAAWRGGHAPVQETVLDEDGEECTVDTFADATAVLDAADAASLPEQIDEMIATATAADKEYRLLLKQSERLYDERTRLESRRFPGQGEEKIRKDWQVEHRQTYQERHRRDYEQVADRLSPHDRAVYDERQQRIDAAGQDGWEPGREAEAAELCGVTLEEFKEIAEIERVGDRRRTQAQLRRLDALKYGGGDCLNPILPPLLEQQAALVCGLTPAEYREMERLEAIAPRSHHAWHNRSRRTRTDAEQARLDQLYAAPAGVTGASQRETHKLRNRYRSGLENHHSGKWDMAEARAQQAAMEAAAQPLDPATAAELQRVTADMDAVGRQVEDRGGWPSATVEIAARNGGALVIEALQEEEEGGVRYRVDRWPADADEQWTVGYATDPYTTTAAGLRKFAKLVRDLASADDPTKENA
ncbi:hypothetical protein ACFYPF_26385 [Micromonospora sp. NPDC005223]|uniref:hypothetical protein n=1 Tax=Micromonospora sp. NPDC005223 TaxID=3364227 RepID=UPI00369E775E